MFLIVCTTVLWLALARSSDDSTRQPAAASPPAGVVVDEPPRWIPSVERLLDSFEDMSSRTEVGINRGQFLEVLARCVKDRRAALRVIEGGGVPKDIVESLNAAFSAYEFIGEVFYWQQTENHEWGDSWKAVFTGPRVDKYLNSEIIKVGKKAIVIESGHGLDGGFADLSVRVAMTHASGHVKDVRNRLEQLRATPAEKK